MDKFPFLPLESYTQDAGGREVGVQRLKEELKEFLKSNSLTFMWLAQNMNKSEGTVKNWVYTSIRVDDKKLDKILSLCKAHASGGGGVSYEGMAGSDALDYIWLAPYACLDDTTEIEELEPVFPSNDVAIPKDVNPEEIESLYQKWMLAAGVPEDTLSEMRTRHYPALARWVTNTLMDATRQSLKKAKMEGRLNMNAKTDFGAVRRGSICACTFYEGKKLFAGYFVRDEEAVRHQIKFFLPVVKDEWRGEYARLAAGLNGYKSTDLWMVTVLNEAAMEQIDSDLADFLK